MADNGMTQETAESNEEEEGARYCSGSLPDGESSWQAADAPGAGPSESRWMEEAGQRKMHSDETKAVLAS